MDITRYVSLINSTADLLDIQNKTFDQLIQSFDEIVNFTFEDGVYTDSRFKVVESFASIVSDRAIHVDRQLLLSALKLRIDSERSKWYNAESIRHW